MKRSLDGRRKGSAGEEWGLGGSDKREEMRLGMGHSSEVLNMETNRNSMLAAAMA